MPQGKYAKMPWLTGSAGTVAGGNGKTDQGIECPLPYPTVFMVRQMVREIKICRISRAKRIFSIVYESPALTTELRARLSGGFSVSAFT